MDKIESDIYKVLGENVDSSIKTIIDHYYKTSGKHIRGHLVLYGFSLAQKEKLQKKTDKKYAAANDKELNYLLESAISCVEIIHLASLVHDDIIDNSTIRRNIKAMHIKNGVKKSILAGDYFFTKAIGLANKLPKNCQNYIVDCIENMVYGELLELTNNSQSNYFKIIEKKTASLFATALLIGYFIGGGEKNAKRLFSWGLNLGKLYQIKDDIDDGEFII